MECSLANIFIFAQEGRFELLIFRPLFVVIYYSSDKNEYSLVSKLHLNALITLSPKLSQPI